MPDVSICIPTYNHARFLKDAVVSASSQRYEDLEILIVDNASQDDTPEIVAQLASTEAAFSARPSPVLPPMSMIRKTDFADDPASIEAAPPPLSIT